VPNPAYRASKLTSITKSIQQAAKDDGVSVDEFLSLQDPQGFPAVDPTVKKGMDEAIAIEEAGRLFTEGWHLAMGAFWDLIHALEDSEAPREEKLKSFDMHWQEMGQKLHSLYATYGFPNEREAAMAQEAVDTGEEITPPGPGETESASSIKTTGGPDVNIKELAESIAASVRDKIGKSEKEVSPEDRGIVESVIEQIVGPLSDKLTEAVMAALMGNAEPEAPPPEMELENPEPKKPEDEEEKADAIAEKAARTILEKAGLPKPQDQNAAILQELRNLNKSICGLKTEIDGVKSKSAGNEEVLNKMIGGFDFADQLMKFETSPAPPVPGANTQTLDMVNKDDGIVQALLQQNAMLQQMLMKSQPQNGNENNLAEKSFADIGQGFIGMMGGPQQ
jgi:hypothetical protein